MQPIEQNNMYFNFQKQRSELINSKEKQFPIFYQMTNKFDFNAQYQNQAYGNFNQMFKSNQYFQQFSSGINPENIRELEASVQRWQQRKKNVQEKYNEFQQI
ncbi:unnamed protein product [Paramecium sonneborni]|uniref:Uncharacterized protein n=1 Tax=Paramecium sonneborni TaxID=65129 RepID=A0A8S1LZI4_9CILI|nr:unnamed protein product [Paramecium sonneborni]